MDASDIPHGDHSQTMNIVNKDGKVEAYEKNKLPVIVPPFAGDVNLETFLLKLTK